MSKRAHGEGSIDARGPDTWRLRYRVDGKRFTKTMRGTLTEARKELRSLVNAGDTGEHIDPTRITVAEWIEQWLALLARQPEAGQRRRGLVNAKTLERYASLLRVHVVPALGKVRLQRLQPTQIDEAYLKFEKDLAPRTLHHIHVVFGACMKAAVRKKLRRDNPVAGADAPSPGESDHGIALDQEQLRALLDGFRPSPLFPIVATLAFTGARRGEVLALRWSDFDSEAQTLRIERAVEQTSEFGLSLKAPKTSRGRRIITIDDDLATLLKAEREKARRVVAGVPDGSEIDLSLVRIPDDALMFPAPAAPGEAFSMTRLRPPNNTTKEFLRRARLLGFTGLRLHDLRGTHETMLLDAGVPVHVVAARCGHDPAVLLRIYAKRTRKADDAAAAIIGKLSAGILK